MFQKKGKSWFKCQNLKILFIAMHDKDRKDIAKNGTV